MTDDNWFLVRGKVVDMEEEDLMRVQEHQDGPTFLRRVCDDFNILKAKDPEMVGIGDHVEFFTCDREQRFYRDED